MSRLHIYPAILAVSLIHLSLSAQTNIAIVDFGGKGVSSIEASALTDRLRTELFLTDRFSVLERELMAQILNEQGFQETGCISTECIVQVGRLIGVEQMVGGSISKVGNVYSVSARLVSVETGKIIKTSTYDHLGEIGDLLRFGMKSVAMELAGITTEERQLFPFPTTEVTPAKPPTSLDGEKKSVSGAFVRGLVLPGWGQFYTNNNRRGYLYLGLFIYGIVDFILGALIEIEPFASEFGPVTFLISEGIAYIIGSIDAAISADNYNKNLEKNKTIISKEVTNSPPLSSAVPDTTSTRYVE